jgi:Peptidase family M28/Repeat of unknown function (DUF346)
MVRYTTVTGRVAGGAARGMAHGLDVHWAQYGDQTVLWGDDAAWTRLAGRLPDAGLHRATPARGRLYFVGQVGREFQRQYPDARVVVAKGRYLAVDLTDAEVAEVRVHADICWTVRLLPENTVIVDTLPAAPRAPVGWVQSIVNQVSSVTYRGALDHLAAFSTRHSLSAQFSTAADWARAQLAAASDTATVIPITVGSGSSANVVAQRDGQGAPPRDLVIVTAHLDSINLAGGPAAPAPGADDNASGAAGVLEIARVLATHPSAHDVRFVLFGGEEEGLHGSRQYVAGLSASDRTRLRAVINMDMIATKNTAVPGVLLEGAAVSQGVMNDLADAASSYTALQVSTSLHPFASDHVPFINASLPAVLTIEAADQANANIHSANDTLAHIDNALALDIVRMNLATAALKLGQTTAAPWASGPVVAWGANRLDVFVIGTDRALYHKWWNGTAWGPSLAGPYEKLGGTIVTRPEVVAWGTNRLDVFVIGTNSALYHKWWNGTAWGPSVTGYEYMGGVIQGRPKAVSWGANRLDVFVIGTDRALYHKWWNGAAWGPSVTGYERMGGVIVGSPEVVSWGANRLDVFVIGTDRALYHKWWNGAAWGPSVTGYEYMGGLIQGQPRAVAWGANRLDVFVTGTDGALYHKWWDGSAWKPSVTGYEKLGGILASEIEAVSWGANRLDVFVIGMDSALYHKWWDGAAWGPSVTGYEKMGGICTSAPRAVAWDANRLDVFVTGTDSALYHKWWNGAAWGPSLTGYELMGGVIVDF